jgi:hypothetical protein
MRVVGQHGAQGPQPAPTTSQTETTPEQRHEAAKVLVSAGTRVNANRYEMVDALGAMGLLPEQAGES